MVFVGLGLLLGSGGLGWLEADLSNNAITGLVEATLAVVLFADASRVELRESPSELGAAGKAPGGMGFHWPWCSAPSPPAVLFGGLPWEAALLIGIILAPTDAALGQAVVTDRSVPVYVRQGLNVESGLNDGLAFPVFEAAVTVALVGVAAVDAGEAVLTLLEDVALGAVAGIVVGAASGPLLSWARRNRWTGRHWHGIATLGIVAAAYGLAITIGGNGFIAAFAAGLAYRPSVDLPTADDVSDDVAELLTMLAFVVFGALGTRPQPRCLHLADPGLLGVEPHRRPRPAAVAISLIGDPHEGTDDRRSSHGSAPAESPASCTPSCCSRMRPRSPTWRRSWTWSCSPWPSACCCTG